MALPAYRTGVEGSQPLTANGAIPVGALFTNSAVGTAYQAATAATNIEPAFLSVSGFTGTAGTIPAGFLNSVGKCFRVTFGGPFGVTATPNLTIRLLLGTTPIATTGALAWTAATSMTFNASITCVVTATGATGTVASAGIFWGNTTAILATPMRIANVTPGTADTVDLTVAQAIHVEATWSVNSASNTIRIDYMVVEFLN